MWSQSYGTGSDAFVGLDCAIDGAGTAWVSVLANGGSQYGYRLLRYSPSGTLLSTVNLPRHPQESAVLTFALGPNGEAYALSHDSNASSLVLSKVNVVGSLAWDRVDGTGPFVGYYGVVVDSIGAPAFVSTTSSGSRLASYTTAGALAWETSFSFGGAGGLATAIAASPSGDLWVAGQSTAIGVHRYSNSGAAQSFTSFRFGASASSTAVALDVDANGFCVCAGSADGSGIQPRPAGLALLDASGALLWTATFSTNSSAVESFEDVVFASDGSIWAGGRWSGVATLVHFDRSGAELQRATWPSQTYPPMRLVAGSAGDVTAIGGDTKVRRFDSQAQTAWTWTPWLASVVEVRGVACGADGRVVMTGREVLPGFDSRARTVAIDASSYPEGYCTAKVNSLGCEPLLTYGGVSSASATSGFTIVASPLLNQRSGLLAYSTSGPNQAPFSGGFLCLQAPLRRTPVASSGGSASTVNDCSGVFTLDMNAFATGSLGGSPAVELSTAGSTIWCQHWSRDPGAASTTGLSNALAYQVLP